MFPSTVDSQHPPSLGEIARRLVSPRTGVIHRLRLLGLEAGEQRAAHVHARLPNLGVLPGGGKIFDAGGSALDLQGAGEALQRGLVLAAAGGALAGREIKGGEALGGVGRGAGRW